MTRCRELIEFIRRKFENTHSKITKKINVNIDRQ